MKFILAYMYDYFNLTKGMMNDAAQSSLPIELWLILICTLRYVAQQNEWQSFWVEVGDLNNLSRKRENMLKKGLIDAIEIVSSSEKKVFNKSMRIIKGTISAPFQA